MTKVLILRNIAGTSIRDHGEPDAMVVNLDDGSQLQCDATDESAEFAITYAAGKGFDIRADVMAALNEHTAPANAQGEGQATPTNSPLAA